MYQDLGKHSGLTERAKNGNEGTSSEHNNDELKDEEWKRVLERLGTHPDAIGSDHRWGIAYDAIGASHVTSSILTGRV